jgi:hypothetical protein
MSASRDEDVTDRLAERLIKGLSHEAAHVLLDAVVEGLPWPKALTLWQIGQLLEKMGLEQMVFVAGEHLMPWWTWWQWEARSQPGVRPSLEGAPAAAEAGDPEDVALQRLEGLKLLAGVIKTNHKTTYQRGNRDYVKG